MMPMPTPMMMEQPAGSIVTGKLRLSGDMTDGDDEMLLSGDMTDGDDKLTIQETI